MEDDSRNVIVLAHTIAHIERALEFAEKNDNLTKLPEIIRREIAHAEKFASTDINASRRLISGDYR